VRNKPEALAYRTFHSLSQYTMLQMTRAKNITQK